jgi:rhamnose utilization protein RhaD (predicted bifunctional aldolase and dehydrogenase)
MQAKDLTPLRMEEMLLPLLEREEISDEDMVRTRRAARSIRGRPGPRSRRCSTRLFPPPTCIAPIRTASTCWPGRATASASAEAAYRRTIEVISRAIEFANARIRLIAGGAGAHRHRSRRVRHRAR